MQTDMHYYATYAIARASGLNPGVCKRIAYASQGTDDNAYKETITFGNESTVERIATAHHFHQHHNLIVSDQTQVWLPFHFLPGNQGGTFAERLVCFQDSELAREMGEHNLLAYNEDYCAELIGITAHVYADTFSHYGFSGVSSPTNQVHTNLIELRNVEESFRVELNEELDRFLDKYSKPASFIRGLWDGFLEGVEITTQALGHGSVGKYPDLPYLIWDFIYEEGNRRSGSRNNPETYLCACRALYDYFCQFIELRPDFQQDNGTRFEAIEGALSNLIGQQNSLSHRMQLWQDAAQVGELFQPGEVIPTYDEDYWDNEWLELTDFEDPREAENSLVYRFNQAAITHRDYVLGELLPYNGIVID